jgi:hypothetical protein
MHEQVGHPTAGEDELGDQVERVVPVPAQVGRGGGVRPELAVQLGEVERGGLAAVVVVAVHVEDLLAVDGEQAGEDALGEAGAEDDGLRG